jgi:hypothetical protein
MGNTITNVKDSIISWSNEIHLCSSLFLKLRYHDYVIYLLELLERKYRDGKLWESVKIK